MPNDLLNNILEFDFALDEDETRGWMAGVQHTHTAISSPFASIRPNTILYAGGYYQWPSHWKFTGRLGMQSFGGAQLAGRMLAESFTQPILRLDLDRMGDKQPPVRRHRTDRLDAEAILPGDVAHATLRRPQLGMLGRIALKIPVARCRRLPSSRRKCGSGARRAAR